MRGIIDSHNVDKIFVAMVGAKQKRCRKVKHRPSIKSLLNNEYKLCIYLSPPFC